MKNNQTKRNVAVNVILTLIKSVVSVLDEPLEPSIQPTSEEMADLPDGLLKLGFYVEGPTLVVPLKVRGYSMDLKEGRDPIIRFGNYREYIAKNQVLLFVDFTKFSKH